MKIIHYYRTRSQWATEDVEHDYWKERLKAQLTDIDHSFTLKSKVSSIGDDYLFNNETVKSGLKRKREAENIVGTKKSKKRLRRL